MKIFDIPTVCNGFSGELLKTSDFEIRFPDYTKFMLFYGFFPRYE